MLAWEVGLRMLGVTGSHAGSEAPATRFMNCPAVVWGCCWCREAGRQNDLSVDFPAHTGELCSMGQVNLTAVPCDLREEMLGEHRALLHLEIAASFLGLSEVTSARGSWAHSSCQDRA